MRKYFKPVQGLAVFWTLVIVDVAAWSFRFRSALVFLASLSLPRIDYNVSSHLNVASQPQTGSEGQ